MIDYTTNLHREFIENYENRQNAVKIANEIKAVFINAQMSYDNAFPLVPYLLCKSKKYMNPYMVAYQDFWSDKFDLHKDILDMIPQVINEALWNDLRQFALFYGYSDFLLAAVCSDVYQSLKDDHSMPVTLLPLVHRILNVQRNEKVADVCCGRGTYMISSFIDKQGASYTGYEIDKKKACSVLMKSDLIETSMDIKTGNLFDQAGEKFDKVFAQYPFGILKDVLKKDHQGYLGQILKDYSKVNSTDWLYHAAICDMLAENGKAVALMRGGSAINNVDMQLRKQFIDNELIECVITLPDKIFPWCSIPTSLIVFSHHNQKVRLVDASDICQKERRVSTLTKDDIDKIMYMLENDTYYSKEVDKETLSKMDYALHINRYRNDDIKIKDGIKFGEIITRISRGASIKAKELDETISKKPTNLSYLMLSDIQEGMICDQLPYLESMDMKYEKYCLKNDDIILAKNTYPFKVALARVKEDEKILASGNLYLIEIDKTKANPLYVKALLESEMGQALLKRISVGSIITSLGVDALKNMEIPLPPLVLQNEIAASYQMIVDEINELKKQMKVTQERLQQVIKKALM